ncbi:MAG: hypothetical protein B5766_05810 [Candidatus Lumbricidophila eiseniae]|uniref:Uncharacterized protein n=1 Tax=Candidatus Lumbricidiphila eiseniae TaxID=1969409 RepID=A0A2A6FSA9_9MICO|nr:MAG: hypothetical protein B5766_05810 [Candidatus Lumbricidophila eiseniae]
MIVTNLLNEYRKLLTARGSLAVVVTCATLLVGVAAGVPILTYSLGGPISELSASMAVAALPLTILGSVIGILIMTMDWQHRDITSILVAAPSRPQLFATKMLTSLIAGLIFSLLIIIANVTALLVLTTGGVGIDGKIFLSMAGTVLSLGIVWTLAGSAVASVLLSLPLTLVFVFVQALILDPALMFARPWGEYFQSSAITSALIGQGPVLPGLTSATLWILLPLVLGAWRQFHREAA